MDRAAMGSAAGVTDHVRGELGYRPAAGTDAAMTDAARAALEALAWNWGEAYEIGFDTGVWWFKRRDGLGGRETAASPDELHTLIVENYTFHKVRREDVP